jgi:hypothetical protein
MSHLSVESDLWVIVKSGKSGVDPKRPWTKLFEQVRRGDWSPGT